MKKSQFYLLALAWMGLFSKAGLASGSLSPRACNQGQESAPKSGLWAKIKGKGATHNEGAQPPDANFENYVGVPTTRVQEIEEIISRNQNSACVKHKFGNRGPMPSGYWKGLIYSFAKAYCRPQANGSSLYHDPKTAWISASHNEYDVLRYYTENGLIQPDASPRHTDPKHLISMFSILTSLGMRESSGNHEEGLDENAGRRRKPAAIEAGLFQTSYDSLSNSQTREASQLSLANAAMIKLMREYKTNQKGCLTDIFNEGIPNKDEPDSVGRPGDPAYDFQELTRKCPAFAVEWALISTRKAYNHYGPLARKEATVVPSCQRMYRDIYTTLENSSCSKLEKAWGGSQN